jgi:hypothetical protein
LPLPLNSVTLLDESFVNVLKSFSSNGALVFSISVFDTHFSFVVVAQMWQEVLKEWVIE